jgi:hypothetical protein
LLPLEREALLKSATELCQVEIVYRIYDCFAAEREQARSPHWAAVFPENHGTLTSQP